MSSNITDRILRSRGDIPSHMKEVNDNEPDYIAFNTTGGPPEMSFTINYKHRGFDQCELIYYHNLGNPRYGAGAKEEYVNFSSRGLAVSLRGKNLKGILEAFSNCTLIDVNVLDHRLEYIPEQGEPVITRIAIHDLNKQPALEDMMDAHSEGDEKLPPSDVEKSALSC